MKIVINYLPDGVVVVRTDNKLQTVHADIDAAIRATTRFAKLVATPTMKVEVTVWNRNRTLRRRDMYPAPRYVKGE